MTIDTLICTAAELSLDYVLANFQAELYVYIYFNMFITFYQQIGQPQAKGRAGSEALAMALAMTFSSGAAVLH